MPTLSKQNVMVNTLGPLRMIQSGAIALTVFGTIPNCHLLWSSTLNLLSTGTRSHSEPFRLNRFSWCLEFEKHSKNTFWDEPSKWYIFVQMKMWRYYTQSLPTDRHGTNWNNMEQLNLPSRFVRISSNFYPKSSTAGLGSEKKSIWSISAFLRMPSHGVTPLVTTQFILRVLNLYTFTHWRSGRLLEDPGKTCKKHKPSVLSSFGAKASENDNLVLQVVVLSNTTESGSSTKSWCLNWSSCSFLFYFGTTANRSVLSLQFPHLTNHEIFTHFARMKRGNVWL